MTQIRTVLGDIDPGELGVTYAHEHVIIDPSYTTQLFPEILLPSVENAVLELASFRKAGGGAMIDCMPCDAGRNVEKLARVSRESGVHLVAPTGLHRTRFYPEGHWRFKRSVSELARIFVREIEEGIDLFDCGGPEVKRSPHRAGVLKIASDGADLEPAERSAFEAVASAHRQTGCPVITHCEPGRGPEQVEFLVSRGVEPGHIVLSHTDRTPEPGYHRELFRTGVFVEYDRVFRSPLGDQNPTLRLFVAMAREFPEQLMLGTDGARPSYWRSYGGAPGLDYLLGEFQERAKAAGVTDRTLRQVFVENPARAYAFAR